MVGLSGKVAIVTGGTSGIGERIVEVFIENGAKVVAAGRREVEGRALEARLGVRFVRTDVASEADIAALVEAALSEFGRIDCLVNNAGIPSTTAGIAEIEAADVDRILAVNVRGVLLATKHVARTMLAQRAGSIVNIASIAAHRGGVSGHIYTTSKGAVTAFTRSAAAELGEKGIRVNCISPGAIVTGIFAKNAGVEASKADKVTGLLKSAFATLQPIPRAGEVEDIALAAAFLASDASCFVNGQDLVIDGGMTNVIRGWSAMVEGRAEIGRRLKAAAEAL